MDSFDGSARERLTAHAHEMDTVIADFLIGSTDEVVEAYASGSVQHNTLSTNTASILEQGLIPGHVANVPDEEDVDFARTLLHHPEVYSPDKERMFNVYVAGTRGERPPGNFLSVIRQSNSGHRGYNSGYGIPERNMILMHEMGAVMLSEGIFAPEDTQRAGALYEKYRDKLYGGDKSIAVLEVDPFSPPVIRQRLGDLAVMHDLDEDLLLQVLPGIGGHDFEGLYVPECIPAADIRDTGIEVPLPKPLEPQADLTRSRFYAPRARW